MIKHVWAYVTAHHRYLKVVKLINYACCKAATNCALALRLEVKSTLKIKKGMLFLSNLVNFVYSGHESFFASDLDSHEELIQMNFLLPSRQTNLHLQQLIGLMMIG